MSSMTYETKNTKLANSL